MVLRTEILKILSTSGNIKKTNSHPRMNIFIETIKPIRKTITTYFNDNPKFVTLSLIKNIVQEDDVDLSQEQNYLLYPDEFVPYPNSYFTIAPYNVNVKSDEELKQHFLTHGASFKGLGSPSKNEKVIALKQIINTLHNNNVKVIVFTTPHSKYYLDAMPENEKISFKNTLKSIEHDTGVKIHSLEEKYRDLELWNDPDHVALTHNRIFGDDVTKIILDEIES